MTCEVTLADNLREAEELALSLGEAISSGDTAEAVRLSGRLSELSVPVCVTVNSQAYPQDSIRLKVGVEDAQSDTFIPMNLEVTPDLTIAQLKEKINEEYPPGFHPSLQRWVIGKRLARDRDTLYSHGVQQSGDQAFLFILSVQAGHFTRYQQNLYQEMQCLDSIMESMSLVPRGPGGGAVEKIPPPPPPKNDRTPSPVLPKPVQVQKPPKPPPKPPTVGWSCDDCTYLNKPTRPGCEMCGMERPVGYQVPDIYQPDQQESQRLQQDQMAELQYRQGLDEERTMNFLSLLHTDGQNLVPNTMQVDCPICFCPVLPGEGATLRECLHSFCRECLKGTIVNSQDAEISCPFVDDIYSCDSKLQDREIQAILTEEEHQRFLELRLSIAESRSEHSFHCQTPNCQGWCIYEDEVNQFVCQLCSETNCILCRAIHKDMNCKEYQCDLRIRAENDLAAKLTKQMLEAMLQSGEAMHCPRCDVIVQKKGGCDWICCLMCKTEICWVTKQARWGPNGSGDTSGGCKCRTVDNQLCHPNCQNCH